MKVEFIFNIDDMVVTPLGEVGIVTFMGVDNSKDKMISVKTRHSETWYREDQLKTKED